MLSHLIVKFLVGALLMSRFTIMAYTIHGYLHCEVLGRSFAFSLFYDSCVWDKPGELHSTMITTGHGH